MWLLLFVFFERLRDEYFSWWYVQLMLSYGTGISLDAYFAIVLVHSFELKKNLVLKCQTVMVNGTSISYLYLPFLYESNAEGTNFRII